MSTSYERYLKDQSTAEELEPNTVPGEIRTAEEAKKIILNAVSEETEPQKPVKTWSVPEPTTIMGLYYRLNPSKRLEALISGNEDPITQIRKVEKLLPEKDYISGMDEIVKGIDKGLYNIQHSTANLLFSGLDLALDTDLVNKLEDTIEKVGEEPEDPESIRGNVVSLLTQYGIPGTAVTKIVGRLPYIFKMKKAANAVTGGKLKKVSQIAARSVEGATIVGVTDFLASEPDRNSIFFEPENTDGLSGRKKAAANFRNKIKFGAEGAIVGGLFPLMGKSTQLGYKYLLAPFVKGSANLGAKTINFTTTRPLELLLGSKLAQPVTTTIAKGIYKGGELALTKAIAPLTVSLIAKKGIYQLPKFKDWRLKSVVSADPMERSVKKLDNFLSWFRSFGKLPKDIEGVSETAQLYIRSKAKKLDKIYSGIEVKSYKLAKKFESQYNTAKTSKPLQTYYSELIEEFLFDQKKLSDLPKEFQFLAKDLKKELINIKNEFNKSLPKGQKADALSKELFKTEATAIKKYLVRSFQTFKNESYIPPKNVFDDAKEYVLKQIILKSPNLRRSSVSANKNIPAIDAYNRTAESIVNEILRVGRTDGQNPLKALRIIGSTFLRNDKYKFLQTGEELPKVIQKLLGKETDLKASILNTTGEMIASMANKRAADQIARSGLKNKWLFNSIEDAIANNVPNAQQINKISRTTLDSDLLNKWASPEYVQAFKGETGSLNKLMQNSIYRFLIGSKATVQMGKTLYSPQTQVRNVTSAAFFAFMQGHIGHNASVTNAMKMTLDDIFKAGQKNIDETEFNNYVEKLVRLGVWDENVVATELKAVMDAIKKNQINSTDKLFDRLMKMAPTDKVAKLYAGGDNMWKHYGFEYSKSQLSQAFKNIDDVAQYWKHMTGTEFNKINAITGVRKTFDDALDEAGAYLLRNTYPTYSRVPPIIQNLRMFPLGNFVSFPAEILRTGANTMMIGLREMSHSNQAIRQMGIRRMTGAIMTSYAIGKGITELSQVLTGSTDSQWSAYKRSAAAAWNKVSNLIAIKGWKNGTSKAINFSYFSPYDSLWKPFQSAMAIANNQDLNPKETQDFVMDLMFAENGPVFTFLSPFVSEPLGYDRFIDVTTRNGKKKEGGSIYTQSDDLTAAFYKSFKHVMDGVQPGAFVSGGKIINALEKDLSGGGKPINLMDELLALFAGVRIIDIDVKSDLKFKASTVNTILRAVDEKEDFYTSKNYTNKPPSVLVKKFDQMQNEAFRIQKQMYINIKDMQMLDLDDTQISQILKKSGMNGKLVKNLMQGIFTPVNYSKPRFERKIEEVEAAMEKYSKDSPTYMYYANRDFLFPQTELDDVKATYGGKYFFDETYNKETKQMEGGYYPEKQGYQLDKKGNLKYDDTGNPIPERGFFGKTLEKGVDIIKELPKKFALPGQDLFSKAPQKPLPDTPMPNAQVFQTAALPASGAINQGLTATENALLSEEEKQIRLRSRGLA